MNLFTISQLQQFSGIKAHTLRIWEQRYSALNPTRSEGNTRYYDNTQLRRLLNIVSLKETDYKISELCSMSDEMLFKLHESHLANHLSNGDNTEYYVTQLIAAGMSFDESHFDKIFSNCVLRMGMRNTYINVIYPLLSRIGLMWLTADISVASEHFITNLLKQKLFSTLDALPPAKSLEKGWLLFLPEDEFHEIGLLFSYYLIREAGFKVVYLGSNVPLETLINAAKEVNPSHMLFFLVNLSRLKDTQEYIDQLKNNFEDTTVCITGNQRLISQLKIDGLVNWIQSVEELENKLS